MVKVFGEPSWRIATDTVEAFLTESGAHLGPVAFQMRGRAISPYHVAPWWDEGYDGPPILRVLRGDFLCVPFGGNDEPWNGEQHPIHGVTANDRWTLYTQSDRTLTVRLESQLRRFTVERTVSVDPG